MFTNQVIANVPESLIAGVENLSNRYMKRMQIRYKNGYALSIIRGKSTYGGSEGLYEIALFNPDGEMDGSLFDDEHQGDDVLGWCGITLLNHYSLKLANL